ncbi:hypothetical protein [Actinoplanes sp. NPDC051494]|uniref:hypothetical protein n=1 Tax=Actinoplanes sp. NPDC051494 TaxID=3363907 RepID=UPI0037AF1EB5
MELGAVIGLVLALFGVTLLVTGRGPAVILRNFPRVRDAGLYHLLFGVAVLMMVLGQGMLSGAARVVCSAGGLVLVVFALIRYRPRRIERRENQR